MNWFVSFNPQLILWGPLVQRIHICNSSFFYFSQFRANMPRAFGPSPFSVRCEREPFPYWLFYVSWVEVRPRIGSTAAKCSAHAETGELGGNVSEVKCENIHILYTPSWPIWKYLRSRFWEDAQDLLITQCNVWKGRGEVPFHGAWDWLLVSNYWMFNLGGFHFQ